LALQKLKNRRKRRFEKGPSHRKKRKKAGKHRGAKGGGGTEKQETYEEAENFEISYDPMGGN